jgi:hypothetical protein
MISPGKMLVTLPKAVAAGKPIVIDDALPFTIRGGGGEIELHGTVDGSDKVLGSAVVAVRAFRITWTPAASLPKKISIFLVLSRNGHVLARSAPEPVTVKGGQG